MVSITKVNKGKKSQWSSIFIEINEDILAKTSLYIGLRVSQICWKES